LIRVIPAAALLLLAAGCGDSSDSDVRPGEEAGAGVAADAGAAVTPASPDAANGAEGAPPASSDGRPPADDTAPPAVDGAPASVLPADLPARVARDLCQRATSCCPAELTARGFTDPVAGACADSFVALLTRQLPGLEASLAAGRARWEPQALAGCLAALGARACQPGEPLDTSACPLVVPVQDDEAPCQDDWECKSGYCRADVKPPYRKDGACAPRLPLGSDCLEDDECQSGSCDFADSVCDATSFFRETRLCGNLP